MDLIPLKESLQESLKNWASEFAIALLPFDVAGDDIGVGTSGRFGRFRNVGDPHAASGDEVHLHFGPPGKVVCPLEYGDLRQGNDPRVRGGGGGIPRRRHFSYRVSVNTVH